MVNTALPLGLCCAFVITNSSSSLLLCSTAPTSTICFTHFARSSLDHPKAAKDAKESRERKPLKHKAPHTCNPIMSVRRTWDKEFYEQKAKDRAKAGDDYVDEDEGPTKVRRLTKEEFQAAGEGAVGPIGSERAFLKSRTGKVDLDSKVGKTEVINPTLSNEARGAGFWCETCRYVYHTNITIIDTIIHHILTNYTNDAHIYIHTWSYAGTCQFLCNMYIHIQ
jgi:hypothetical protein